MIVYKECDKYILSVFTRYECDCDRMYCRGCKVVNKDTVIQNIPNECPNCKSCDCVSPIHAHLPEYDMEEAFLGSNGRDGYKLLCTSCKWTSDNVLFR